MPTTYRILSDFQEIGTCEGIPGSDAQGTFIAFPPEQYSLFQLEDTLVTSSGEYLELYYEELAYENGELVVAKVYYH